MTKIIYFAGAVLGAFLLQAQVCQAVTALAPAGAAAKPGAGFETKTGLYKWQVVEPGAAARAYFVNLKDGDRIETPFVVKFGLSGGWGLAPITAPARKKSGHHHLLINQELPLNFTAALPFTDNYKHFGKGQMESVLALPPGDYTLRLLLADDKHLPHFVYSKPIKITVTALRDIDLATVVKKGVSLQADKPMPTGAIRVQFHASGFNVAHQAQQIKDTGHFRLRVSPVSGGASVDMDFTLGQTEVWLKPPAGEYRLTLDFLDNQNPQAKLTESAQMALTVQ